MIKFLKNLFKSTKQRCNMPNTNYKLGWIEEFNNDLIICKLRKDYELDDVLTFGRGLLTKHQNKLVRDGQIIKYDKINGVILFKKDNGNWC